jgi:hypothetical protein
MLAGCWGRARASSLRQSIAPRRPQVGNLWFASDGSTGGDGTATNSTSSLYYHWGPTNVDTQTVTANDCARATSTGAYWFYTGDSTNYTQVKTATFYNSSVTANNVFAWLATSCASTTVYAHVCKINRAKFACPASPPPAPAPPPSTAQLCELLACTLRRRAGRGLEIWSTLLCFTGLASSWTQLSRTGQLAALQ